MSFNIVDRRVNGKNKSSSNRQRFMRRVNTHVKRAVRESIKNGNIRDIVSDDGQDVVVPKRDITEPWFHHARGGNTERVYPGNKDYVQGDRIPKPPHQGGGQGSGTGGSGDSEDDFEFMISKKEYMDIFFEDLELPDLVKKSLASVTETKLKRSGYSVDGVPSRLNYVKSLRQSVGRRAALRNPKKRELEKLERQLEELQNTPSEHSVEIEDLKNRIAVLTRKIRAVPFIDTLDLRYNRFEQVSIPTTRAVMFMIMDVSGSMDEFKKEMAKRFYMLLYLFLHRNYEHIDIVPIRHHTLAKEVDEEEFFYSKESGGTLVSPALELAHDIMKQRYDSSWNVYICQASDGDNSQGDDAPCVKLLNKILPAIQYYAYIQIGDDDNTLSQMFERDILYNHDNVDMAFIDDAEDIFPVFRKLFEKED